MALTFSSSRARSISRLTNPSPPRMVPSTEMIATLSAPARLWEKYFSRTRWSLSKAVRPPPPIRIRFSSMRAAQSEQDQQHQQRTEDAWLAAWWRWRRLLVDYLGRHRGLGISGRHGLGFHGHHLLGGTGWGTTSLALWETPWVRVESRLFLSLAQRTVERVPGPPSKSAAVLAGRWRSARADQRLGVASRCRLAVSYRPNVRERSRSRQSSNE